MKRRTVFLGGAAALLLGGCAIGSSNRNANALKNTPPEGQFLDVNGTKVHYVKSGKGPALVLIHGAGSNLREWTFSLMGKLTDRFTVIAFDRPGHGYTDTIHSDGETPAEQAKLLHDAMLQLKVKKAIIAGHSYGGAVTLAWTLNHFESVNGSLVISGVSNRWEGDVDTFYKLNGGAITGPLLTSTIAALAPEKRIIDGFNGVFAPQKAPDGYIDHMGTDLAVRASQLRANGRQVSTMKPHIVAMSKRYDEIKTPFEIIHGTEDKSVGAHIHSDILVKQIPQSNYQRIEGMGHGTQQLAHDEILTALGRLRKAI